MRSSHARLLPLCVALLLASSASAFGGDSASGTVSFKNGKLEIKHGFLVRGPDEMNPNLTVLRLYLTNRDIGAKLRTARTLSEADRAMADGAMVDFGDASHLLFAVRLNDERLQYSGATTPQSFSLAIHEPNRLAGKLQIDKTAAGGAKLEATFDLTVLNTFADVR